MKSTTVLRLCLVFEWVFVASAVAASFLLESSLPEPLSSWLRAESERDMTGGELIFALTCVPLIISIIVATIGLLCLRRWAAWLYLITAVVGVILMPLSGPHVEHAITDALGEIGSVMSGMVIALAFFTDSLGKKTITKEPPPMPSASSTEHTECKG